MNRNDGYFAINSGVPYVEGGIGGAGGSIHVAGHGNAGIVHTRVPQTYQPKAQVCEYCGQKTAPDGLECRKCGAPLPEGG